MNVFGYPLMSILATLSVVTLSSLVVAQSPSPIPSKSPATPNNNTIIKTSRKLSGFSRDSNYYLYLESWIIPITKNAMANLDIIDVSGNVCVQNGCLETENDRGAKITNTDIVANKLLKKTELLRYNLGLMKLSPGRRLSPLYYKVRPNNVELFSFKLEDEKNLEIFMQQKHIPSVLYGGNADIDRAALRLEVKYNYKKLTLSTINNYRELTLQYRLREVVLSPDGNKVVLVMNILRPTHGKALQKTLLFGFNLNK